jgi:hypothetical protein
MMALLASFSFRSIVPYVLIIIDKSRNKSNSALVVDAELLSTVTQTPTQQDNKRSV